MNIVSVCLFVCLFLTRKFYIIPSILNDDLTGQSSLSCRFFPFSTVNVSCPSLLACKVPGEKPAVTFMKVPLKMTGFLLLLLAFFVFKFCHCNSGMSWSGSVFILLGTLCGSCIWRSVAFFKFGKFSSTISPNTFSMLFSLSSPPGTSRMWMLVYLMLLQRSLNCSHCFIFLLLLGNFHYSFFRITYAFSVSPSLL